MGVATALLGALAMPVHAQAADSPGSGAPVGQASTRLSAALQSLSLSGGDLCPAFAPATTAYTATVADDVSETTVSAIVAAGTVTVQPSDADLVAEGHQVSLSRGDNEITITVDEPGLAQRTYTIDVKRALLIGSAAQRVEYDLGTGFANLVRPCEVVIGDFHASVKLKDETDAIDSIDYATRTVQTTGNETKIVHTDSRYPQMTQVFKADSKNIKTHLVIEDATDPLSTNHMVPIKLKEGAQVRMALGGVGSNRVLRMPSFQPNGARWRFTAARGESLRSYNVTAFYENSSRKGLIIGAITHKNWRTAINLTLGSQGSGPLTELTVTSGVAAERDVMEHGYLSGNEISSATIVMGVYDDFRLGLEDYAEEVKRIQPKLASAPELEAWDNTTFSWKTWGKGSKRRALTYANVLEVLDFTEKLKDQGFANKGGYAIVALAAHYWDLFTEEQWHTFADECVARGLLPGWYMQPWLLLDAADLDDPIYEDATYTFRDITTKDSNGDPLGIVRPEGTKYALDPTHPGTRARIDKQMDWAIEKGFRWLRMDFTYFGSLEGVYHDTSITTGIQAYNSGMKYITDKAGGKIHINLAISPYFPHNTGHSRRISGDVYHSISDVEYELNALAGGWWLGNGVLYEYLDPGVVDFHPTRDDAEMSRTKVNSAAITGMLQADDDWNKARFRGLAEEYYLNSDVLALIGKARSFMPVDLASGRGAPDSFVHHEDGADGGTTYYAVFNYSTSAATKTITADRFIPDDWNDPQYEYAFYELWDKTTTIRKPGATWDLELPARGSKIYKIARRAGPAVGVTDLSALALSGIDIGTFAAGTTSYAATVANDVASTQVTAAPNDADASVTITDANGSTAGASRTVSLAEGTNTITVTVTAEDGVTTQTYTVTVTREAATETALTAGFERVPDGHDGSSPFELRIRFSEELAEGSGRKVARALSISGATRGIVLRVGDGRDLFKFPLTPSGDGAVTVSLGASSGCGANDSVCTSDGRALSEAVEVTIQGPSTEPEPEVSIAANRVSAVHGADGVAFTLTRDGPTGEPLTVSATVSQARSFLATASLALTVTIPAGSASATFGYTAADFQGFAQGALVEGGALTATLVDGADYDTGTASASVDIVVGATFRLEKDAYAVAEDVGTATFQVIARTGAGAGVPTGDLAVAVGTAAGTATSPEDYAALAADVSFAPGDFVASGAVYEARKSVAVTVEDDATDEDEDEETFDLRLVAAAGAAPGYRHVVDASGRSCGSGCAVPVTIGDDDQAIFTVSAAPEAIEEGESATLTVAISNGVTFAEDKAIELSGSGTASAADYSLTPTALTLAAGSASVTATLAATADQVDEEAETLTVTASHGGSTIGSATVTINSTSIAEEGTATQNPAPRPNILVVVTDDLGWGQPGFNGGTEVGTPNLDRIANEGVKLTQFYVSPGCSPTRSALLTGRHYWKTGGVKEAATRGLDVGVLLDERLMSEALRDAGYETWAIGKWHLGQWHLAHLPLQRGFDHHYGMYSGFITYGSHRHLGALDWHRNGRPVIERGYSTFLKAEEAVQLIGRHDGRDPFFLYLAFNAAHGPDGAPEEYVERYADAAEPVQRAQVKALDDALGWVLDALEDKGVLDDTLVVYLNDNGGTTRAGSNAPYRGLKGSFHEGGIRVPAAMRWPGRIPEGSESDALLHVVDVFPTLAGLAGASTTDGLPLDGLDAWQAIAAGAESPRQELAHSRKVIRVGDWKLLDTNGESYGGRWSSRRQLYNIAEDPYEKTNLAGSEPAKVAELRTRLTHHREAARGAAPAAQMPEELVTYGFDENAAYGTAVERAYTELQAGNPGPTLVRLEAAGDRVRLVYDEPVDTGSVPPESAFRVVTTPGYAAVDVTDVEASGSDVVLTLALRLAPGTTVGITYDVPDSGGIRDADGLEAVGTTWQTGMASSVDPVWLSTATVEVRGEYRGYSSIAHPDLGAVADHAFDFGEGAAYQVQVVMAYSDGVMFQVRNRGEAISGLVLEWVGETLPLADATWHADWDRYTWSQAWLDANAPSLNASAYAATLPDGSTTEVCLRFAEQTCPEASTAGGSVTASADATLSSLALSGVDIGTFAAGTTSYSASVGNAVASTQVTVAANDAGASVTIADGSGSTDGTSRNVSLAEGSNTITVTVTAENGTTTKAYAVTVTRAAASTDATLSSLSLSGIDIGTFAAGTTAYTASVGNAVASTQVTAATNDAGASVTIADGDGSTDGTSRSVSLAEGSNTITVTVTAEDGTTTKAYAVTVTRAAASTDATLSSLFLSGIDIGTFAAGTTAYTASVGNAVASTQVTAVANDAGAGVAIADGAGSTDGTSRNVSFDEGSNTITVTVTAEDGTTTQTYTVTVARAAASTDATLSSLVLSGVDIGPFAAGTTSYTASVGNAVASTEVTATASQAGASVTIADGAGSTDGTSRTVALAEGANTITVTVTATDGETTGIYTVTVTRDTPVLTARFENPPNRHDGSSAFDLSVRFSEELARGSRSKVESAISVSAAERGRVHRVGDTHDLFTFTLTPSGNGEVSVRLRASSGCSRLNSICTADGRALSNALSVTVGGPDAASTDAMLSTLALSGIDIGTFAAGTTSYSASVGNAVASTQVTVAANDAGASVTIADGSGSTDGTSRNVSLAEGSNTITVTVTAEDGTTTQTYTVTVTREAAPTGGALTAGFENEPEGGHDGSSPFELRVRFSEELAEGSGRKVARALSVSGATRGYMLRVGATRDLFKFELTPSGNGDVTVSLTAPSGCGESNSVCTADGRVLSNAPSVTVDGPAAASASVNGLLVTLSWPSPRDEFGSPSASDYGVQVNGATHRVALASLAGSNAWLTLEFPVAAGDTVTVAYLGSAMHPLAEAAGRVRSGPWEGLVAENLTGMEPPGAPVAIVDLRHADPLAAAADGALRLDASGRGLTEVWGLARFTALERLDLSGNALTDLSPLAGLVNLRDLDLSRNRVADLWPLAGLYNLERLNLADNVVTDVAALAGLPNLTVLLLDGNAVADLWPLGQLATLENLGLGGNRIGDLTALQDLPHLRRLDLAGNPAADLSPLGDLGSLVWLALPGRRVGASEQTLGRLTRLGWVWFESAESISTHDVAMPR